MTPLKLDLDLDTTPTAIENFTRGIKLIQLRKQLEVDQKRNPDRYIMVMDFLNDCDDQPATI